MQKEYSEEDYNEIVADITWYPGIASEFLDSIGVRNEMVNNQMLLVFKSKKGKRYEFHKDSIKGNMILFRNDTVPIISSAIDFDNKIVKDFFKK